MQEEVAEAFKASRTPIRQAFHLLEKDGLVERLPQGGFRITRLDLKPSTICLPFAPFWKPMGSNWPANGSSRKPSKPSGPSGNRPTQMLASSVHPQGSQDTPDCSNSIPYSTKPSIDPPTADTCMELISNLRNTVLRLRALGFARTTTWKQSWDEHGQLIDCLERRDKKAAGKLMRRHVASAMSHVLSQWNLADEKGSRKDESAAPEKRRRREAKRGNEFRESGLTCFCPWAAAGRTNPPQQDGSGERMIFSIQSRRRRWLKQ